MATQQVVVLTRGEKRALGGDFANALAELAAGATLASGPSVVIRDENGEDVSADFLASSPAVTISGTKVVFWKKAAADGTLPAGRYTATIKVTLSNGEQPELKSGGELPVYRVIDS